MTAWGVTGQSWLLRHAWIVSILWGLCLLFSFMALRELEGFRRLFWRAANFLVPRKTLSVIESIALSSQSQPEHILRDKVLQLGRDLFAFLREKRPLGPDSSGWYAEQIRLGYQHRFKQRVVDLFNELAENGITDPEIQGWEIDPPEIQNADRVRKIAGHLFMIAARMDIAEEAKGA
jgi:hypothetical protein